MKVAIHTFPPGSEHEKRGIGAYTRHLIDSLRDINGLKLQEFHKLSEVIAADLVHYPYFDLFFNTLPFVKKFPTVVTIHDVTPLIFGRHYPPGIKGGWNLKLQKLSLKNTEHIITDSNSSKKDISKFLNIKDSKIFVVYLAPDKKFGQIKDKDRLDYVKKKYNLPKRFALYVGGVNWNKNLAGLTKACIDTNMDLCLIGNDFENKENLNHPELKSYSEFLNKYYKHPLVHTLGFVEDYDVIGILNLSRMLLLPSFYEGFGLTVLEAQACGTPVVTSNVSSMPEVAGDGALYVDPYDIAGIAVKINELDTDEKLQKKIIKKGFENVKKFSWRETARQTFDIYTVVANK